MIATRRPSRWGWAIVLGLAGIGCGHERGTGLESGRVVTSVAIAVPATVLRVGDTLRASAVAADSAGGAIAGRATIWQTSDASVANVNGTGLVLGVGPGVATISATIDGHRATVDVQVVRPPVASVTITPDSIAIAASVVVDLGVVLRDADGRVVSGLIPTWTTSAPGVAIVSATGRVTGVGVGRAEISATADGVTAKAVVIVTRPSNVVVTGVSPSQLTPGANFVVDGSGFSTNRTSNTITVGGVPAIVRSATPTQIAATVASTGYGCEPTRDVPIVATVTGESGTGVATLQVAPQRSVAAGQSVVLADPAQARCVELAPASGRLLVAVYNVGASPAAVPFTLRGARGVAFPGPSLQAGVALAAQVATSKVAVGAPGHVVAVAQAAGDTVPVHVLPPTARTCNDATTDVRGRTVYVGRKVTVLEDVGAPLAGTMDDDYRRIGQEFDDVTIPMLEATFGNPLAVDSRLSRTGRVTLFFTRAVNERPATLGVTLSCDLLPASVARASNENQIVYLAVPTSAASGLGTGSFTGTRDAWRRRIRTVAAHEAKHLTSYAERIARAAPFEEPWVEEGSALVAEELFARAVRGLPLRVNTPYRESLACELRPDDPGCSDVPVAFSDHFARLYRTLSAPATLTPFGADAALDPTGAFYGASWWLLRWAADQTTSDAAFFRALTAGPQVGIENVSARLGRPWGELLGDWWLATAVDDLAGFVPPRAALAEPSWNLRDVFAGAQTSGDPRFALAFPLAPRALPLGDFVADAPNGVRGGGAAFFELSGPAASRQLLELRPIPGGPPPTQLGIAIVRVP